MYLMKNELDQLIADKVENNVDLNSMKNKLDQILADKLSDDARMRKLESEIEELRSINHRNIY